MKQLRSGGLETALLSESRITQVARVARIRRWKGQGQPQGLPLRCGRGLNLGIEKILLCDVSADAFLYEGERVAAVLCEFFLEFFV